MYTEDLVSQVSSELSGDLKTVMLACLQAAEEPFDDGLLSIILDESLSLTVRGCDVFGLIVLDMIQELDSDTAENRRGDLRRLQDISLFLQEPSLGKRKDDSV
jgi:hypothetical protein